MRTAVPAAPVAGLRPQQRVPRHLQRLVQVPQLLRMPLLRTAVGVSGSVAFAAHFAQTANQGATTSAGPLRVIQLFLRLAGRQIMQRVSEDELLDKIIDKILMSIKLTGMSVLSTIEKTRQLNIIKKFRLNPNFLKIRKPIFTTYLS